MRFQVSFESWEGRRSSQVGRQRFSNSRSNVTKRTFTKYNQTQRASKKHERSKRMQCLAFTEFLSRGPSGALQSHSFELGSASAANSVQAAALVHDSLPPLRRVVPESEARLGMCFGCCAAYLRVGHSCFCLIQSFCGSFRLHFEVLGKIRPELTP